MTTPPVLGESLGDGRLRLTRRNTADQAADTLRGLILKQQLEAGRPLRETELSVALGISRNTVREALRLLAREGLVVRGRHRVATVALMTVDDISDIFVVRLTLEFGATDVLARRDDAPDLAAVRASVDVLRRITALTDWQSVMDADHGFHSAVVSLARSERLSAAYARLEAEIRRCMAVTTRAHPDPSELYEQHAELLDYLERRDYDSFKERLGRDFRMAESNIVRVLIGDDAPPVTPAHGPTTAPSDAPRPGP